MYRGIHTQVTLQPENNQMHLLIAFLIAAVLPSEMDYLHRDLASSDFLESEYLIPCP